MQKGNLDTLLAINSSNWVTTLGLNQTDDVISSNLEGPVLSAWILLSNTATTYPGHMTQYLHSLFMNVGTETSTATHEHLQTVQPLSVLHA